MVGKLLRRVDPPKIFSWKQKRTYKGLPLHVLLEGTHRSTTAKVTGRPIVLKPITRRKGYSNLKFNTKFGNDPIDNLYNLTKNIDNQKVWGMKPHWGTEPIKVRLVKEKALNKKQAEKAKRLLNEIYKKGKISDRKVKNRKWVKKLQDRYWKSSDSNEKAAISRSLRYSKNFNRPLNTLKKRWHIKLKRDYED